VYLCNKQSHIEYILMKFLLLQEQRSACMANHSATHLLNFALGRVLGEVRQQGSMVGDSNFTFDFTCHKVCRCLYNDVVSYAVLCKLICECRWYDVLI